MALRPPATMPPVFSLAFGASSRRPTHDDRGFAGAADPIPRRPGTWRVATWNLWGHFGDEPEGRLQRIEATLRRLDADVVALQEVYGDQAAGDDAVRLGEGLGHHLVRLLPDPDRATAMIGNALLSRWPVVEQGGQPLPNLLGTPGHRQGLWAVLAAPFGRLPVIATHLAYRFDESAVRQQQVRALLALADRLRSDKAGDPPVILCGDLNAVPDSDELRLLTGRSEAPVPGLVFNDCWPQVRPDAGHTWVRSQSLSAEQRLARTSARLCAGVLASSGSPR